MVVYFTWSVGFSHTRMILIKLEQGFSLICLEAGNTVSMSRVSLEK